MDNCIYCGSQEKITKEHVIPRGVFPEGYTVSNPIIVPACQLCNNRYSKDEEFFRNFITTITSDRSKDADKVFNSSVRRSIRRMPNIGRRMTSLMEEVELISAHGIYIGQRTKINIPPEDWQRYDNVINKIVRGLFYHQTNRIIPEDYCARSFWGHLNEIGQIKKEFLDALNNIPKWNKDNHPIFVYGYGIVNDTSQSVWATFFYDSLFFLSFIITHDHAENLDNKTKKSKLISAS